MKRAAEEVPDAVLRIDCGGTEFRVARQTLVTAGQYFPYCTLTEALLEPTDGVTPLFVDTDPKLFRHLLQLLRRPCLSATMTTPQGVAKDVWQAELDYWGMGDRLSGKETRGEARAQTECAYARNFSALETLGGEIRAQIRNNEVGAVRALLEQSGYGASRDKVRSVTLMVPLGQYQMECGTDLGHFLLNNGEIVKELLLQVLGHDTDVKITEAMPIKNFDSYQFAGQTYSTKDTKSVRVKLDYGKVVK